uniref:Superoxide dismutase [Cu-Zn] n=1 Tax=Sinohyriopsis cumingii TaxID=165450 RepID=F6LQK4_SINCU|nr:extracellular copper/zinc superoxide dismutase [Sinohyriopsis cumingii]AEG21074.1 extracellular copper/zinc superoxide dismutase [Sinohyriopsis cumingii]
MAYPVIMFVLFTVVISFRRADGLPLTLCPKGFVYAECRLTTNPNMKDLPSKIEGTVYFRQKVSRDCRRMGMLNIRTEIQGIPMNDQTKLHGLHVHALNNLSNGCDSLGPHFNPFNATHGAPTDTPEMRHVGDFGNVRQYEAGHVAESRNEHLANLVGPNSIIGRGLVLHAKKDDLGLGGDAGSLTTGNAGARLACCIIEQTQTPHFFY